MAEFPASLFFKNNKQYGVGSLVFDLILTEDHSLDNTVTNHAVEDGSEISDHIQNELEKGSLTGLITNFSIRAGAITSNRAQDAFDLLYSIWKERSLVTVTTIHKTYENVAIISAPVARDTESAESIVIQINFQQVKVVKLQSVVIETEISLTGLSKDSQKQVAPKTKVGRSVGNKSSVAVVP